MIRTLYPFLFLIFSLSASFALRADEVSMWIDATPAKTYQGSPFRLRVHIEGASPETPPDMSYLKSEFQVEYEGPRQSRNTRMYYTDGGIKRIEEVSVIFSYILTPKNSGTIEINPPQMIIDGKNLEAAPITVEVVEPNGQDLVELEVTSSRDSLYPNVPFELSLSVYVKELPDPYQDRDPIQEVSRQVESPALSIPWGLDSTLPSGLIPTTDWQSWMGDYQNARGGFSVNGISQEGIFGFSLGSLLTFLPRAQYEERNGSFWKKYTFTRTFTAEKIGSLTIDPSSFKGNVIREGADGKLEVQPVYTISDPIEITVRDVPAEGRRDDYIGAFGKFFIHSSLSPSKLRVGEATTFTITLEGKGSVLNVTAPDLEKNEWIREHFKIYPPTEQTDDGKVQWTWSLRALEEEPAEFPPVTLSYFDVEKEEFIPLTTEKMRLTIEANSAPTSVSIRSDHGKSFDLERSESGIFGNRPIPRSLIPLVTRSVWVKSLSGIWGIAFLWILTLTIFRRRAAGENTKFRERISSAEVSFRKGMALLSSDHSDIRRVEWLRALFSGFVLPVSDQFSASPDAISTAEFSSFLARLKKEDPDGVSLYEKIEVFVRELEEMQYGSVTPERIHSDAWRTLHRQWTDRLLHLGIKTLHKLSSISAVVLLLLPLLTLSMTGCSEPASLRESFQQAETIFQQAEEESQEDSDASRQAFFKAAALYEGIAASGGESGELFFNLGNAYYRAGDSPHALCAWRRAEAYIPNDPYLRANIDSILPAPQGKKLPLFESIFPWQNHLSITVKGILSIVGAFLSALTLALLFQLNHSPKWYVWLRRIFCVAFLFFLVMTLSYQYDLSRFTSGRHGITTEVLIPRKGASERYEPLYRNDLPALTEFRFEDQRGGWIEGSFSDGQRGWIPEGKCVKW